MIDKNKLTGAVQAYQGGDVDVFDTIYAETQDNLYVYAKYLSDDETTAEDLLQSTYLEVLKYIQGLNDPGAFLTWSKKIMLNLSKKSFQKNQEIVLGAREDEEASLFDQIKDEDKDYQPEENLDIEEVRKVVLDTVETLGVPQKLTMTAFYYDEMSIPEIAEMMDVSVNTVKSRLFQGRQAVKTKLEDYEEKHGIRLHSLTPTALIKVALGETGKTGFMALSKTSAAKILAGIKASGLLSKATLATSAAAVATASATTAATTAGGLISGKIIAVVLAALVTVGGGGYFIANAVNKATDNEPAQEEIANIDENDDAENVQNPGNEEEVEQIEEELEEPIKEVAPLTPEEQERVDALRAYGEFFGQMIDQFYVEWDRLFEEITPHHIMVLEGENYPLGIAYYIGGADMGESGDMYGWDADFCTYIDGKVVNLDTGNSKMPASHTWFDYYVSDDRRTVISEFMFWPGPGLAANYYAEKYEYKDGKFVLVEDSEAWITEDDEAFDAYCQKFRVGTATVFKQSDTWEYLGDFSNTLLLSGISTDVRPATEDWREEHKREALADYTTEHFEGMKYWSNAGSEVIIGHTDTNGDGIPEVIIGTRAIRGIYYDIYGYVNGSIDKMDFYGDVELVDNGTKFHMRNFDGGKSNADVAAWDTLITVGDFYMELTNAGFAFKDVVLISNDEEQRNPTVVPMINYKVVENGEALAKMEELREQYGEPQDIEWTVVESPEEISAYIDSL